MSRDDLKNSLINLAHAIEHGLPPKVIYDVINDIVEKVFKNPEKYEGIR